jgi:putative heme-binding domain-containing protein
VSSTTRIPTARIPSTSSQVAIKLLSTILLVVCTTPVLLPVGVAGQTRTQLPEVSASQEKKATPIVAEAPKPAEPVKSGPKAEWIWGKPNPGDGERFFLLKTFTTKAKKAKLTATCDNHMTVWVNGKRVAASDTWESPVTVDVSKAIKDGENTILAEVKNDGSLGGFAFSMKLEGAETTYVISDKSWHAALTKEAHKLVPVTSLGKMGMAPWKDIFSSAKPRLVSNQVRDVFNVLPGFQVELLYTVPKNELGSWVCIAFDNKGRIIASDQGGKGLYLVTPSPVGSNMPTTVEPLGVKMTGAHGMIYAFDSLYVSANGGPGSGLYRIRDTNGDDKLDEVTKLKEFRGGGEHGPHSLRLSPDGKSLYVIAGNHTDPPSDFDHSRLPSNWSEDLLLPRQWDARGHARGKLAPGGWIAKTDPEGNTWELVSSGYRNPFDMDFNGDGELFAYDADMEWDMGTPWYRPTRVNHVTSGSEFGWRSGTGKWPSYFVDSLPEVVDIGPGSPVGVTFGTGTKFPAKYQKALYLLDWTFGTMYAIHLTPSGSSYVGKKEEFLSRTPLPLTDAAVGPDGALYFTVGGRGAQSALYRVTYVGKESTTPADLTNKDGRDLRQVRRSLEDMHGPDQGADSVAKAWPYLGHADRHIRYAARLAVEQADVALWQDKALAESNPIAAIEALVALSRQGKPAVKDQVVEALQRIDFASLSETGQLNLLRAYSLAFIRLGEPSRKVALQVAGKLDPFYPAKTTALNRELCRVLCYLSSTKVIDVTLELIDSEEDGGAENIAELLARNSGYGGAIANMIANHPALQKIHYAFALRTVKYGWTLDQRKKYFHWIDQAKAKNGGASYGGFMNNIRSEAWANVTEPERAALEAAAPLPVPKTAELPKPQGPGHKWTLDELVQLSGKLSGRSFENGKRTFAAAQCISCHRFIGHGGAQGPDLSNVAGRFGLKDLGDSLINPNKVISDQYRHSNVTTVNGKVITGRIVNETDSLLVIATDPLDPSKTVEVKKSDVDETVPSKVSPMPAALLDRLNEGEVLDLLAYLMSRGDPNSLLFQ